MDSKNRKTHKESLEDILKSRATLEKIEYVREILSSLSSIICIINESNQIVFTNDVLLNNLGIELESVILGKRPGEIFECDNADKSEHGCGFSEGCEYCGANNAIQTSWREKRKVSRECKITSVKNNKKVQLDLELTATPMFFDTHYLIVSIIDISEKKHKQLLERIFFHDILNTAGSLSGIIDLFPTFNDEEKKEYVPIISSLADQIVDEIKAQRQMIQAEAGELSVDLKDIDVESFMNEISDKIRFHQVSYNKNIDVKNLIAGTTIHTDELLLSRILINMAKNALEAIEEGETITIKSEQINGCNRFSIHNQSFIPRPTQLQIFKRSFSTKETGRGLGTYSMKLLGEKFLKGHVNFHSTKEKGTTFFIDLPISSNS